MCKTLLLLVLRNSLSLCCIQASGIRMGVCLRASMRSVADSASRSSRVGQIRNSAALVATHGREESAGVNRLPFPATG